MGCDGKHADARQHGAGASRTGNNKHDLPSQPAGPAQVLIHMPPKGNASCSIYELLFGTSIRCDVGPGASRPPFDGAQTVARALNKYHFALRTVKPMLLRTI